MFLRCRSGLCWFGLPAAVMGFVAGLLYLREVYAGGAGTVDGIFLTVIVAALLVLF